MYQRQTLPKYSSLVSRQHPSPPLHSVHSASWCPHRATGRGREGADASTTTKTEHDYGVFQSECPVNWEELRDRVNARWPCLTAGSWKEDRLQIGVSPSQVVVVLLCQHSPGQTCWLWSSLPMFFFFVDEHGSITCKWYICKIQIMHPALVQYDWQGIQECVFVSACAVSGMTV